MLLDISPDRSGLDEALEQLPNSPAVFLLFPREGDPYLSRTALLRRRLLRLLKERERPSRLLNLRHTVERIEYQLTGSRLESAAVMYGQARRYFPDRYRDVLKLRLPPYVKVVLENRFPRTRITSSLGRAPALYYGPFRSRVSAEAFESRALDLFQMRRCAEELEPSPQHPGCIYGEMSMCLRPCQQVVAPDEYRHEVDRVVEFLASDGRSLVESISASRDRLSEELQFEEAARQHKRLEKVQEAIALRDGLAHDLDRMHGVAIAPSVAADAVEVWFVRAGHVLPQRRFSFEVREGKPAPMDRALRELISSLEPRRLSQAARSEWLALLARWYYSTWCDGEWLAFDDYERIPYRKLVHAISRVGGSRTAAI